MSSCGTDHLNRLKPARPRVPVFPRIRPRLREPIPGHRRLNFNLSFLSGVSCARHPITFVICTARTSLACLWGRGAGVGQGGTSHIQDSRPKTTPERKSAIATGAAPTHKGEAPQQASNEGKPQAGAWAVVPGQHQRTRPGPTAAAAVPLLVGRASLTERELSGEPIRLESGRHTLYADHQNKDAYRAGQRNTLQTLKKSVYSCQKAGGPQEPLGRRQHQGWCGHWVHSRVPGCRRRCAQSPGVAMSLWRP